MLNFRYFDFSSVYISGSPSFWVAKRFFDLLISFFLLFPLLVCIPILGILNLFYNKGPIFFIQKRMGKNCMPFNAIKFRTMISVSVIERKFSDPLEMDRITSLGKILRKLRLDELPQILNVIKGEMSLIGPRPDYYEHALVFLDNDKNYRKRHAIRPGISGLSQIRLGYAEGLAATRKKSKIDVYYIENASFYLDLQIMIGTILTVVRRVGV
jgi:lipopolysaccharide/colanic/teichoic acid biosynthesis glycosyltransferase